MTRRSNTRKQASAVLPLAFVALLSSCNRETSVLKGLDKDALGAKGKVRKRARAREREGERGREREREGERELSERGRPWIQLHSGRGLPGRGPTVNQIEKRHSLPPVNCPSPVRFAFS